MTERRLIKKFPGGHSLFEQTVRDEEDVPVLQDDSGAFSRVNVNRPIEVSREGVFIPVWDFNITPATPAEAAFLSSRYRMPVRMGEVYFEPRSFTDAGSRGDR